MVVELLCIPQGLTMGPHVRGVAQPGRVLRSGRRSRRFESSHPDQKILVAIESFFGAMVAAVVPSNFQISSSEA